jgi:hypothetical protein
MIRQIHEWFDKLKPTIEVLTFITVILNIVVIFRQCKIMEKQTNQTDQLMAYSKKRDSIQDHRDSLDRIDDSVAIHVRDSLYGLSLDNAKQQLNVLSNTFEISERPYLSLKSIKYENYSSGTRPKILATIYNSGKVDAINFENCSSIVVDSAVNTRFPDKSKCPDKGVNIGSGSEITISFTAPFVVENEIEKRLQTGKSIVTVHITGSFYRFGDKKRYPFGECRYYEYSEKGWTNCKTYRSP